MDVLVEVSFDGFEVGCFLFVLLLFFFVFVFLFLGVGEVVEWVDAEVGFEEGDSETPDVEFLGVVLLFEELWGHVEGSACVLVSCGAALE